WSGDGGFYSFENGHMMLWTELKNPEERPIYAHHERLKEKLGDARADNIVNTTRNLCLYPNAYLIDQISTQIRLMRLIFSSETKILCGLGISSLYELFDVSRNDSQNDSEAKHD